MKKNDRLIIFGCGGHARAVLDVIVYNGEYDDIVFVHENAKANEKILNFPVLSNYGNIKNEKVFVAIGDNSTRKYLCEKYYNNLISIISKNAYIGQDVEIGKGVFVGHNTYIGIFTIVEDFCIVNTGSLVEHECVIGKVSFIGPNATLCGRVRLGQNVFVGAGTTIIEKILVGNNIVIGAGNVVLHHLSEEGIYVGIPVQKKDMK